MTTRECPQLAVSYGVSQATGYRYKDEAIKVLAEHAPDLHEVLAKAEADHVPYLILDGSAFTCDRLAGKTAKGNDLWYSGKEKEFCGNVQGLADPRGDVLWSSDVRPGHTHDIVAAEDLDILGALYAAAAKGLPTLADSGYQGAGIGIKIPIKRPGKGDRLAVNNRTYNKLQRGLRAPGERMFATLKERWKALRHITISPSRIGDLVRAALVLHREWEKDNKLINQRIR